MTDPRQAVICLHASASSSRQWRALGARLGDRFRVVAPDLYGSGNSPQWADDRPLRIADEVAHLEDAFRGAGEPVHLVGHSYGGLIALHAALANPGRIRSLVLFEPVAFGVLLAEDPDQPAAREVLAVQHDTEAAIARGDLGAAAERFIDYWMGTGAWANMLAPQRAATAPTMLGVRPQFGAILGEPTPLPAYAAVKVPTLFLTGTRSPAPSRAVARLLIATLPDVTAVELDGVGHMAPVTHPDLVNAAIDNHLVRFA
jgi:pimeloyl-ACP methyl ester carboxylesterase